METITSSFKHPSFLQSILEGLIDGILILTDQGEWVHANHCARRICHQLSQGVSQTDMVPQEIWRACKNLIDNFNRHPNKLFMVEDEIITSNSISYRVRAQWLNLETMQRPCVLVTLEDRLQSVQSVALSESQRYALTPREAEVWLRYRANYSYKEIAQELYITCNTVKKHMKNIHVKRQTTLSSGN